VVHGSWVLLYVPCEQRTAASKHASHTIDQSSLIRDKDADHMLLFALWQRLLVRDVNVVTLLHKCTAGRRKRGYAPCPPVGQAIAFCRRGTRAQVLFFVFVHRASLLLQAYY